MKTTTVKELRQEITSGGGAIKFKDIVIEYQEGKDIDFKDGISTVAYISSTQDPDTEARLTVSILGSPLYNIDAVIQIAQFFEYTVGDITPTVSEKIVTIESPHAHAAREKLERDVEFLKGQIDVYQSLVVREINIKA